MYITHSLWGSLKNVFTWSISPILDTKQSLANFILIVIYKPYQFAKGNNHEQFFVGFFCSGSRLQVQWPPEEGTSYPGIHAEARPDRGLGYRGLCQPLQNPQGTPPRPRGSDYSIGTHESTVEIVWFDIYTLQTTIILCPRVCVFITKIFYQLLPLNKSSQWYLPLLFKLFLKNLLLLFFFSCFSFHWNISFHVYKQLLILQFNDVNMIWWWGLHL